MPIPSEMTDAELRERLNQVSVTVQRIRFQDGREAYYHAKRWASEQNKPIRQELKRRGLGASPSSFVAEGAGPRDSAPDADAVKRDRVRRYQAATKEYTDAYRTYGIAVKDHRPDAEHWHSEVLRTHAALDAIAKEA